jgi:Ricin-type beta-trefoil lectin domain
MSQPIMKFFAGLLLVGLVFAGAGVANAFEITQGIPNTDQTACADVQGNQTNSGTAVQAYPCNGGFNEQWSLVATNLQGLGTSASGANCANPNALNTELMLDSCGSPPPFIWLFSPGGEVELNTYGRCLDSQFQYGSGAQIALNACGTAFSEVWVVRDLVITQAIPNSDETACVDVQGAAIANNTPVNAYPCTFGLNERWTYVDGQLQGIGTSKSQSTCLGATNAGAVALQTCNSSNQAQQWSIEYGEDSSGDYGNHVVNSATGECLDSQNDYGNAQLAVTRCAQSGSTSQLWIVR